MTANEISERVAAAEAELDRVHKAACNGSAAWRVSIPVNEQRDSDVLIGNGLSAVKELLAENERLQTALAAAERERDVAVAANATAVANIQQHISEYEARIKRKQENLNEEYDKDLAYDVAISEAFCDGLDRAMRHMLSATRTTEQAARQHDDAAEGSGER